MSNARIFNSYQYLFPIRPRERRFAALAHAILDLTKEKGYAPSVKEVGLRCGMASSSTAHKWLLQMKAEGLVTWEPDCPRTLRCL